MTNKSTLAQRLSHAWPWTKPIGSSPTTSRLLRFSLLCMLLMLCGGSMWAEDVTATLSGEAMLGTNPSSTSYSDYLTKGLTDNQNNVYYGRWCHQNSGGSYLQMVQIKKVESSTATRINLPKYSGNIKKITLQVTNASSTTSSGTGAKTRLAIINSSTYNSSTATNTDNQVLVVGSSSTEATKYEFDFTTLTKKYDGSGLYICSLDVAARIWSIVVTYDDGSSDTRTETALVFDGDYQTTGTAGGSMALPTALVKTVVDGVQTGTLNEPTITWESSNTAVATIEGTTINFLKGGSTTITASYAGDETQYKSSSNSFDLTIKGAITDGIIDFNNNQDYGSGAVVDGSAYITEDKTWTAGNVTLVTSGKYRWHTDGTLRIYDSGDAENPTSLTISVPDGKVITKIEFTGNNDVNTIKVGSTTISDKKWEGKAQSVTFTRGSDNAQISTITVTYEDAPAVTIAAPTFSPVGGTYYTGQYVEISCTTEGATIKKSYDGKNFETYNEAFPVLEDKTIWAYAEKDGEKSETVSATYIIGSSYDSFSAMQTDAAAEGFTDKAIQYRATGGMTVAYVNGKNAYLIDGSGNGMLIYNKDGLGTLAAGQKMNYADGYLTGTLTTYKGNAELTNVTFPEMTGGIVTVTPVEKTLPLTSANQSTLVTLKGVTYNSTDKTLSDGTNTIAFYDKFSASPTLEDGKTYDVTGIVNYNNETLQISPRTADDVVEATPTIETVHIWANVTGNEVAADDIATVSQALFGRDSGFPTNYTAVTDKELFTLDEATGKYTLSYTNVNVPADGMGISWTVLVNKNSLASSTFKWVDIDKAGLYDITFTYDPTATENQLTATATKKDFYILGVAGWSLPADLKAMTWDSENEVYTYTFTSTADATYFCFADGTQTAEEAAADNEWTTFNSTYRWALGTGGNYTFDLDNLGTALELSQGDKTIVLPAGEWTISVTADKVLTITGEAAPDTYVVAGGINGSTTEDPGFFGTWWDTTAEANKLNKQEDGTYSITYENVEVAAGTTYHFKFYKNGTTWIPDGNDNLWYWFSEDGTYNITITYDPNGETPSGNGNVTATKVEEPATGFRDIKADLTGTDLLPDGTAPTQYTDVSTGVAVAEDGTLSRVATDATNAAAVFNGRWHGTTYGWNNFTATVPVDGCVKITLGASNYGSGAVIVTDSENNQVAKIDNHIGKMWSANNPDNVAVGYYRTNSPTTLTFSTCDYIPYFAVEAINEEDLPAEVTNYNVTFAAGEGVEGVAPAAVEVEAGNKITAPANYTLYKDGSTLTGWSDGETTYAPGDEITPAADMQLTAVFTENAVSLADRTEAVTVTFPLNGYNNNPQHKLNNGGIIVTQVTIGESSIDVKADVTGSLVANGSGWHYASNSCAISVPSCKGASMTVTTYSDPSNAIKFENNAPKSVTGTANPYTASYETASTDATLAIAATSDIYISNIAITLPVVSGDEPGDEPSDVEEEVTALWDFRSNANPRAVGLFQGQNAQGKLDSNVQGIQLDIDATTGKFDSQVRTSDAQVNNGTVIKVPVRHAGDEVTVLGNYQVNYTIGANEESVTELSKTYTATEADAQLGNVVITSTGTTYFYYIQVVQKEYIAPVTGFDNVEGSIKWTIGNENSGTVSDDIKEAIGSTSLTVGGDLTQTTNSTYAANNGVEMVVFNPKSNKLGTVESAMVEYRVKVKAGLKFKPTSVSYDAIKDGTDDATYSWSYTIDGEESQKTVVAKDDILRNNNTTGSPALTHVHNLTVDETSEFTFRIYVSGFNSGKKLALSNIIINGTVNGTIEEIPSYTLTAVASPEEGGSVKITPAGGEYEEGSTIKVTATPNFGYHFVKWQDATETTVSEDATYSFDIQKNEELTAVFTAVETYALTVNVEGGNSYQVTASPEATDGKYEAGTEVTLTAVENPVVKFTNWSTSATEKEIKVTINEDTEITANFAATDEIVAAWDFYEALGNSGKQDRAAAFKGENNDGTILTLRNAEGTSVAWLDRNYTNPYNGAICAINWQKDAYGVYYWQTKVNASSYKTMKVYSEMYYNYRAYNKYDVQYSVDGTEWTTLGTFELSKDDWSKLTLDIPEAADNKEEVYVRWIKAGDAELDETASDNNGNFNDGIGIANIFITGTKELVDDGTAPVLQSQVPAANSENASINGQVVLTFDEKIQLTGGTKATLGEEELEPIVAGKALMFKYQGLDYDTEYTFTLPANFVSDLMNNTLEEEISFTFKTMTRPTVTKAAYDFIVPYDGTFAEAVAAANSRSDKTKRYFIFVKKGEYQLMGTGETENAEDDDHNPYTYTNRITDITASNISIIGEDRDATILYNSPDHEGIGVTATLRITKDVENTYIEDITIKNAWEYTGTTGRAVTIQDKGTRTIAKNVKLLSYQDTYYSNNQSGEFFFEDGEIHGTVDFVCGTGDVIYKDVTLYLEKRTGNVISAPNQPKEFGYVFLDCTIDGDAANEGTYYLGRPWGTGVKAQFVNTQMKVTPAAAGWTEMGAGRYPAVFAEFNSYKEDMSPIDLSGRKTSFGASDTTTAVESSGAELTTEQVASLTVQNIFGDWLPTQYTIQEEAPSNVKIDQNGKLTWDADDYALCYVVCADGDAIAVTTENSFDTATAGAPALRRSGDTVTYTVRAANAMGGLGEESAAASPATGIAAIEAELGGDVKIYDLNGRRVMTPTKGVYIINGKKVVIK